MIHLGSRIFTPEWRRRVSVAMLPQWFVAEMLVRVGNRGSSKV